MSGKFHNDMTYEEWASKQDKNMLEFKAIESIHKLFPRYNLESIKSEIYANCILTMENQENHIKHFGQRHTDPAKLNRLMDMIISKIYHPDIYKSADGRGHGATLKANFRQENGPATLLATRIEQAANRQIDYLIEHKLVDVPNKSDFIRKWVSIGSIVDPFINDVVDPIIKQNSIVIRSRIEKMELAHTDNVINELEDTFQIYEQKLEVSCRRTNNRGELIQLRDRLDKYIRDMLSSPGNEIQRGNVEDYIKNTGKTLHNVLYKLHMQNLISKEYIDTLLKEAVAIPILGNISDMSDEDMKTQGNH